MRNDKYFIESVIIALVVPIVIGAIYFRKLYVEYNVINPIIAMDAPIEIVYYGNEIIDGKLTKNNDLIYNFDIKYDNGKFYKQMYSIYLKDLSVSDNSINWVLFKNNINIAAGVLDYTTNKILIVPNEEISMNEIAKYELRFYTSNESLSNIKGKIIFE